MKLRIGSLGQHLEKPIGVRSSLRAEKACAQKFKENTFLENR